MKKTDILFEAYDDLDLLEILKLRVEKALDRNKAVILFYQKGSRKLRQVSLGKARYRN